MHKRRWLALLPWLLLFLVAAGAVLLYPADSAYAQSSVDRDDLAPIDDSLLIARLTDRTAELLQSGKATGMKTLMDGLGRSRSPLAMSLPDGRTFSAAEIHRKARQSVVILGAIYKCSTCQQWHLYTSAGFVISPSGIVATNYHVVEKPECQTMAAMTFDGKFFPVREVLAASRTDDIAILRLEGSGFTPLPLSEGQPVGSPVFVLSHPDGRLFSFTAGIISRYFLEDNKGTKSPRMAITADYARGSSGAPVLNEAGAVVGMVSTTSSIYYSQAQDGSKDNLQMVVKSCIPSRSILGLLR